LAAAVALAASAIPPASPATYKNAMAKPCAGTVDLYPGDCLTIGLPVTSGISWGYPPLGAN
jgi:hypothetical protein